MKAKIEIPHAEFEIWCNGMKVAGVSGPVEEAKKEARHYAFMYAADGPIEIYRKCGRKRVLFKYGEL